MPGNWLLPLYRLTSRQLVMYTKCRTYVTPPKPFFIQKLSTAVGRERSPDSRLPKTKPILFQLVRSLQHTLSLAEQRILFTAMFLIAVYGFFRIGELASKSPASCNPVVQFNNLSFLSTDSCIQSLKITICQFKHNTNRWPVDVIITRDLASLFAQCKQCLITAK